MAKGAINCNKLGLTLGIFLALLHGVWALLVGLNIGQNMLDWVFPLHFLDSIYKVTQFNILIAIMLIIMALLAGYVMGYVFALIYNWIEKM